MEAVDEEIILTSGGRQRIEDELDRLVRVERHEVAARIKDAKDYGDLTENAEYEAAKNAQAFVEGRIIDLKSILSRARTLRDDEIRTDSVGIGSVVTVRDEDYGDDWTFTLVSPFEADPDRDMISDQSPVGKALVGRKVGESVTVNAPAGAVVYGITEIGK